MDSKNVIAAISLSAAVIILYSLFFEYLSEVNAYVDDQAPWALKKTDSTRMQDVLYLITLITIKCSVLLQPVIPSSIDKTLKIYNLSLKDLNP